MVFQLSTQTGKNVNSTRKAKKKNSSPMLFSVRSQTLSNVATKTNRIWIWGRGISPALVGYLGWLGIEVPIPCTKKEVWEYWLSGKQCLFCWYMCSTSVALVIAAGLSCQDSYCSFLLDFLWKEEVFPPASLSLTKRKWNWHLNIQFPIFQSTEIVFSHISKEGWYHLLLFCPCNSSCSTGTFSFKASMSLSCIQF